MMFTNPTQKSTLYNSFYFQFTEKFWNENFLNLSPNNVYDGVMKDLFVTKIKKKTNSGLT